MKDGCKPLPSPRDALHGPKRGFFGLTGDIVHRCDFNKVASHYIQPLAAANDLQSLGRKQTWAQGTRLTSQIALGPACPLHRRGNLLRTQPTRTTFGYFLPYGLL